MPLTVSAYTIMAYGPIPEGAYRHFINVDPFKLSEPYNLASDCEIKGKIIAVTKRDGTAISELSGLEVTLILDIAVGYDRLFISRSDWEQHFRDWGLVKGDYLVEIKLTEILHKETGKSEKIYPKADIRG